MKFPYSLLPSALLVFFILGLLASPGWGGADPKRVEYELRQRSAELGCPETRAEITKARKAHPESARLARLAGECDIHRFDYEGAAKELSDAVRLDPDAENAQLYLAVALYHLEEFDQAWTAIQAANGHYSASAAPQYEFYRGLLLLQQGEQADAAAALERAAAASPGEVEPVASYYAGLSFMGLRDRKSARAAFERVAEMDAQGQWGKQAKVALESVALEERNWIGAQAGLEYDSNVVLLGDGIPLAGDISGQSDGRGVWFLEGGIELFDTGSWSGGLVGNYAGSAYFNLNQFDVEYPMLGGWLDRWVGERSLVRLRYSFGHAWVDYDSFVSSQNVILSGYHDWEKLGRSEIAATWEWNDYKYDIPAVPEANPADPGQCLILFAPCAPLGFDAQAARNRDGNGLLIGLQHEYKLASTGTDLVTELRLRAGFRYRQYWAKGRDWNYSGYRLSAGFDLDLPWKIEMDGEGSWEYVPFDHPSSYPTPPLPNGVPYTLPTEDRLDQVGRFTLLLSRPITRNIEVSARYFYIRNNSNVAVFDYGRHIVGTYVSFDL
ncbi:MAG: hypothetical protein VX252_10900 [Myxococcota bacterium]|nr:hypothetical protein [Myxococcota bacterium]